MDDRILVTYASRLGSTQEVALTIAQTLRDAGETVDVMPVQLVKNLASYRMIILGSAIRYGRWLPDAAEFVATNRELLNRIPTAFFTVCMTLAEDTKENRRKAHSFLDPIRALVTPIDEAWFAGKLDYRELTFMQRIVGKIQKLPEGDFRAWDQIGAWASTIP